MWVSCNQERSGADGGEASGAGEGGKTDAEDQAARDNLVQLRLREGLKYGMEILESLTASMVKEDPVEDIVIIEEIPEDDPYAAEFCSSCF